ncbi:MAG: hypothetical protein HYU66_24435 [Armatimonadetes bacterium]|nr:hypothetical protein [Armatimonadota bacterium]
MSRHAGWLVLWLLTAVSAEGPLGPRIDLVCQDLPLQEVLTRLGRQLNRQVRGGGLTPDQLTGRPVTLELRDATPRDALDALEKATGYHVRRMSRWEYNVDDRRGYGGQVRSLGGLQVVLQSLYYSFSSVLPVGDPEHATAIARVTPTIYLVAPSDPEALRIASVAPPAARLPDGSEVRAEAQPLWAPDMQDPSRWEVARPLPAPPSAVDRLSELWLDITWCAGLQELVFGFATPQASAQTMEQGGFQAQLEAHPAKVGTPWRVQVAGPVPWEDKAQRGALANREQWAEGRLYDAAAKPLHTRTQIQEGALRDNQWRTTWQILLAEPDQAAEPARLELRFYVPGPPGRSERLSFADLPLPPRPPSRNKP